MNGNARAPTPPALAAAILALAAWLGGCADIHRALETPRVNPESPVAPEVAAGVRRNYPTPLLRDVPPVPKNVPPAAQVKVQVGGMVVCRRAMAGYVIDHPPLSGDAATFATEQREIANITPADVPPPDSAAKSEAYAAELRAEAAPPPAISSGPAPTPQDAMPPAAGAAAPAKPPAASKARPAPAPSAVAAASSQAPVTATAVAPPPALTAVNAPPLPAPLPDPLLAHCS